MVYYSQASVVTGTVNSNATANANKVNYIIYSSDLTSSSAGNIISTNTTTSNLNNPNFGWSGSVLILSGGPVGFGTYYSSGNATLSTTWLQTTTTSFGHYTTAASINGFETARSVITWNGTKWLAAGLQTYGVPSSNLTNATLYYNTPNSINIGNSIPSSTWTLCTIYAIKCGAYTCIVWNGILWVAGGACSVGTITAGDPVILIYSPDGINWYPAYYPLANDPTSSYSQNARYTFCYSLVWNVNIWIAMVSVLSAKIANIVGSAYCLESYDGINWKFSYIMNLLDGNNISNTVRTNFMATRRVLPYIGYIVGEPYAPTAPTDWPSNNIPQSISQALNLLATYFRNTNPSGTVNWPL